MLDATTIEEIRAIIDRGLGTTQSRELIAASEVTDLLLDLRLLLATTDAELEAARRFRCTGRTRPETPISG